MTLLSGFPACSDDSGAGQDGTVLNATFFAAIKNSILSSIQGATDPNVGPGATTDEVLAARGSLGSLDGRLDISLNEDGTLKSQSGLALKTELGDAEGNRDLAVNGDFAIWTGGAAAAPDGWTLSGAGAAAARCGTGEGDTTSMNTGKYCVKITYGSAIAKLLQQALLAADFTNITELKNKKLAVFVRGKTSIVNHLSIVVDDGVTVTRGGLGGNGTYHSGGGTVETLYAVHTISGSATKLDVYLEVAQSGAAYAGGVRYLFSDVAIGQWDKSALDPSEVIGRGAPQWVLLGTQGASPVHVIAKALALYRSETSYAGVLSQNAAETDLYSVTIPKGCLSRNGQVVRIMGFGGTAANGNSKAIKVKLIGGSLAIPAQLTQTTSTFNNQDWIATITMIRISATQIHLISNIHIVSQGNVLLTFLSGATSIDWDNYDTTIKITGQGTSTGDVLQRNMTTEVSG